MGADSREPGWGHVSFQGLLPLERAATQKYAPEIAAGGRAREWDDAVSSDDGFFACVFCCCILACLCTQRGQRIMGAVPVLRPLLHRLQRARQHVLDQKKKDIEAHAKGTSHADKAASIEMANGSAHMQRTAELSTKDAVDHQAFAAADMADNKHDC